MIELNNKYAVDGRDPNSYSGIFWVLGRYDRAWGPERKVFGKIRYMSSANTRRKLRVDQLHRTLGRMAAFLRVLERASAVEQDAGGDGSTCRTTSCMRPSRPARERGAGGHGLESSSSRVLGRRNDDRITSRSWRSCSRISATSRWSKPKRGVAVHFRSDGRSRSARPCARWPRARRSAAGHGARRARAARRTWTPLVSEEDLLELDPSRRLADLHRRTVRFRASETDRPFAWMPSIDASVSDTGLLMEERRPARRQVQLRCGEPQARGAEIRRRPRYRPGSSPDDGHARGGRASRASASATIRARWTPSHLPVPAGVTRDGLWRWARDRVLARTSAPSRMPCRSAPSSLFHTRLAPLAQPAPA